ncbi:hypothetical protein GCM10020331_032080 [Ectobacillus funiculus]
MQQVTFVHLQCQTVYSLLQSACKIEPLVRRAKELGFQALAITDQKRHVWCDSVFIKHARQRVYIQLSG